MLHIHHVWSSSNVDFNFITWYSSSSTCFWLCNVLFSRPLSLSDAKINQHHIMYDMYDVRRLESGSDYAMYVKDQSSDAEHTSSTFTIIGATASNVEVTSPDG